MSKKYEGKMIVLSFLLLNFTFTSGVGDKKAHLKNSGSVF